MDRERCAKIGFDLDAFLATPRSTSYDNEVPTSLYVVGCGNYVKVGIAVDIPKRIVSFQVGNPFPITLLKKAAFGSRLHALLVERTVHKLLADERHFGEWFVCSAERATEAATLVTNAMRLLAVNFRRQEETRRIERIKRYENDPAYRAQVDADRASNRAWFVRNEALERTLDAAKREFDRTFVEPPV